MTLIDTIVEFFIHEITTDQDSVNAKINAILRINQVSCLIGREATKKKLVPKLDEIFLNELDLLTSLYFSKVLATTADESSFLIKNAPEESLHLIWTYFAFHQEKDIREFGLKALENCIRIIDDKVFLLEFYNEHISSSLIRKDFENLSYLQIIAGIEYISNFNKYKNDYILSKEEESQILNLAKLHPSPYVKGCIAKNLFNLLDNNSQFEKEEIVQNFLKDSNEFVSLQLSSRNTLFKLASKSVSSSSSSSEFKSLIKKFLFHESWRVQIESIKVISSWILIENQQVVRVFTKLLQEKLNQEEQHMLLPVKIVICETISNNHYLLNCINLNWFISFISSMEEKPSLDVETRFALAQVYLNIFQSTNNIGLISLNDILIRIEHEKWSSIKEYFLNSLLKSSEFFLTIKQEDERMNFLKKIYSSLSFSCLMNNNDDDGSIAAVIDKYYYDVTLWRSTLNALETCPSFIKILGIKNWSKNYGGEEFLEFCFIHPCSRIGISLAKIIPNILIYDELLLDWFENDYLPLLSRVSLVYTSTNIQTCILLSCEILLNFFNENLIVLLKIFKISESIILRAIIHRSPSVRIKGIQVFCKLIGKVVKDELLLLYQHLKRLEEKEHDVFVKKEIEIVIKNYNNII